MNIEESTYQHTLIHCFKESLTRNKFKLEDEAQTLAMKSKISRIQLWISLINFQSGALGLIMNRCIMNLPFHIRAFSIFFHFIILPTVFEVPLNQNEKTLLLPIAEKFESELLEIHANLRGQKEILLRHEEGADNYKKIKITSQNQSKYNAKEVDSYTIEKLKELEKKNKEEMDLGYMHTSEEPNQRMKNPDFDNDFDRFAFRPDDSFNDPSKKLEKTVKEEENSDGPYAFYINQAKKLSRSGPPHK